MQAVFVGRPSVAGRRIGRDQGLLVSHFQRRHGRQCVRRQGSAFDRLLISVYGHRAHERSAIRRKDRFVDRKAPTEAQGRHGDLKRR